MADGAEKNPQEKLKLHSSFWCLLAILFSAKVSSSTLIWAIWSHGQKHQLPQRAASPEAAGTDVLTHNPQSHHHCTEAVMRSERRAKGWNRSFGCTWYTQMHEGRNGFGSVNSVGQKTLTSPSVWRDNSLQFSIAPAHGDLRCTAEAVGREGSRRAKKARKITNEVFNYK